MTYLKFADVVQHVVMAGIGGIAAAAAATAIMGFSFIGAINVVVVVKQLHLLVTTTATAESFWRLKSRGSAVM